MIGVRERIKNNVLLKCSTLNEEVISKNLVDMLDKSIYQFAEELVSLLDNVSIGLTESDIRQNVQELIKVPILKKIKRKLFIDSLALQITNDSFIEDCINEKISLEKIKNTYIKELEKNKKTNQLNMTEDLNLTEIIQKLSMYIDKNIVSKVSENQSLVTAINNLVTNEKEKLEKSLEDMIDDLDKEYLSILTKEIEIETKGEESMPEEINDVAEVKDNTSSEKNKFDKYDDMTLFNKMILSLNTKEEKLSRYESKLEAKKQSIEALLNDTNKKIELNIDRENKLSQRQIELNSREKDLNKRLSEAEVIFLNMKPLIKGLNNIKASDLKVGDSNE